MNTQFKKGILEMCILYVINEQDMYGFEVIERLAKDIDVNENTVYPILRRLTSQDLFTTYQKQTNLGAPRKYYKITTQGQSKLNHSLDEWKTFLNGVFHIVGGTKHE
ncbi:MAG: PadR family transcriptional regulator [Acholeplasmataceae bacterium]|nr:PadR family transcriptional regulator [Acholeplasmataceae bacterium]